MALTAELARPECLIGIDLRPSGSPALDEFISSHGLHDELHPHYGVDQADTGQLQTILAKDLGDDPLDLVVDDASHLFEPTRRTFNYLFHDFVRPERTSLKTGQRIDSNTTIDHSPFWPWN